VVRVRHEWQRQEVRACSLRPHLRRYVRLVLPQRLTLRCRSIQVFSSKDFCSWDSDHEDALPGPFPDWIREGGWWWAPEVSAARDTDRATGQQHEELCAVCADPRLMGSE
jgi:hypothetical protein